MPPPVAVVPISGNPPEPLVFDSLRLVVDGSVRVRASRVETLRGRSVETPLGRATIQDARLEGRRAGIVVWFEWVPGLRGETPIRPEVTLALHVRPGGVLLGRITLPLGEGAIRTATFTMPSGGPPRAVVLEMRSFGLFVPGPVVVSGLRGACR